MPNSGSNLTHGVTSVDENLFSGFLGERSAFLLDFIGSFDIPRYRKMPQPISISILMGMVLPNFIRYMPSGFVLMKEVSLSGRLIIKMLSLKYLYARAL